VLVGGLPPSATKHRAWWSGDRPHVNAWRLAGFTVTNLVPGREVTFTRNRSQPSSPLPPRCAKQRRLPSSPKGPRQRYFSSRA
jgi:hypothetical protein